MKRNHDLRIKVSKEEYERLKMKAAVLEIPVSTYVRFISLSAVPRKNGMPTRFK